VILALLSSLSADAVSALETSISALESSISALESRIKALESSSIPWEESIGWFTALVFIGVAFEFWVIWREHKEELEDWTSAIFWHPLRNPRPSFKKHVPAVLSVVLVWVGIAGELCAGLEITSINGKLRGINAELQSKGSELRSKNDQLLALITGEVAEEKRRADEQQERAAKAETDLARLRKSLAPRRLSAKQKDDLAAVFKSFGPIGIHWADSGDGEAADLASDLVGAATIANTTIKAYNVSLGEYFRGFSFRVGVKREAEAVKLSAFLRKAFPRTPISYTPSTGDPNNLAVVVGLKP